jgi:hypothetical protein
MLKRTLQGDIASDEGDTMVLQQESNTMGSFIGDMSWGGVSVGSWIRDEHVSPLSMLSSCILSARTDEQRLTFVATDA